MNYKLVLQYDGNRYHGWQKQGNTCKTIQGVLEKNLEVLVNHPIEVYGSGRTDSGVHAIGQVANFSLYKEIDTECIKNFLNQNLGDDILVRSVEKVGQKFHSRLDARGKTYLYRIYNSPIRNVFLRKYTYHIEEPLNINRMKEAAEYLIGEFDFRSFTSLKDEKKSTVRTITNLTIEQKHNEIYIWVEGNGFLYNMVRIMVGTLIEIGEGTRKPDDIPYMIESKNRENAGATAPAHGLYLWSVDY